MQLLTAEEIRIIRMQIGDLSDQLGREGGQSTEKKTQLRNLRSELERHRELKDISMKQRQDRLGNMINA